METTVSMRPLSPWHLTVLTAVFNLDGLCCNVSPTLAVSARGTQEQYAAFFSATDLCV